MAGKVETDTGKNKKMHALSVFLRVKKENSLLFFRTEGEKIPHIRRGREARLSVQSP